MSDRAIVVGAGAIGMASAHYLERAGWQVTVIDRGEVGGGCSYGNACMVLPSHSQPLPRPGVVGQALRWMLRGDSAFYVRKRYDPSLFRWGLRFHRYCNATAATHGFKALLSLSRPSLELFTEIAAEPDINFLFDRRGLLQAYLCERGVAGIPEEVEHLTANGFDARELSVADACELEPALSPRVHGTLYIDGEALVFSYGYVRALARSLHARGATILTGSEVTGIRVTSGRVASVMVDDRSESGVVEISADLLVLAAGAWSPALAESLGMSLPMQPAKGYSCTIDTYDGSPMTPIHVIDSKMIITPLQGRLRFAGTLELTGFDQSIHPVRYRAIVEAAHKVLAHPFELRGEERWCGLRPLLPDGLPVIDRLPGVEGVIVATGHAMLGLTQSPITGHIVARLAGGEQPTVPIEAFRIDRF